MGDCEVDVDSPQNIISFCTGYGGIELGLRRAGVDVRVICNVEIEAFVQANLVAKIEEGRMDDAPIYSDLKTFPARIFRGKIHGIIGGYPCQPFSSAGKRKGEKDPRHLWPYIREHVRAIRPLWCFFENVRGHTTMGLWRVLSDLEAEGYRTEFGLFSAEETGAPHQRIRCFILAYHNIKGLEGFNGECSSKQTKGVQADIGSKGGTLHKLAHTASREPRQSQARNGGQDTSGGSEEELGNSARIDGKQSHGETDQVGCACEEDRGSSDVRGTEWPARPGEEQYEWEEPRVVADSKIKGCRGLVHEQGKSRDKKRGHADRSSNREEHPRQTQSELGGSPHARQGYDWVDPIANRVDRLRLLGNGVVPQTAEIAWRTLWKEMNNG